MWWIVLIFLVVRQGFGQSPEWREVNDRGKQLWESGRCREAIPLLTRAREMVAPGEVEGAATVAMNHAH
ncbi:MAG: hypothetical protein U0R19_10395 [Bryobacteraceae bacterium]